MKVQFLMGTDRRSILCQVDFDEDNSITLSHRDAMTLASAIISGSAKARKGRMDLIEDQIVAEYNTCHVRGYGMRYLANKYGVSHMTIKRIVDAAKS